MARWLAGPGNGRENALTMGIGLLLSHGQGLRPNLEALFDFFRREGATPGSEHLLVRWHCPAEPEYLLAALPRQEGRPYSAGGPAVRFLLRSIDCRARYWAPNFFMFSSSSSYWL